MSEHLKPGPYRRTLGQTTLHGVIVGSFSGGSGGYTYVANHPLHGVVSYAETGNSLISAGSAYEPCEWSDVPWWPFPTVGTLPDDIKRWLEHAAGKDSGGDFMGRDMASALLAKHRPVPDKVPMGGVTIDEAIEGFAAINDARAKAFEPDDVKLPEDVHEYLAGRAFRPADMHSDPKAEALLAKYAPADDVETITIEASTEAWDKSWGKVQALIGAMGTLPEDVLNYWEQIEAVLDKYASMPVPQVGDFRRNAAGGIIQLMHEEGHPWPIIWHCAFEDSDGVMNTDSFALSKYPTPCERPDGWPL